MNLVELGVVVYLDSDWWWNMATVYLDSDWWWYMAMVYVDSDWWLYMASVMYMVLGRLIIWQQKGSTIINSKMRS